LAETVYEGMFLLDSNRYGRDPDGVAGQIPTLIREAGGEILVSRLWEERRLAYEIKGRRKGAYWLTYFRIDPEKLVDLKRQCRLRDSILRVLFVKIDSRIVDTLVEHAQAGQIGSFHEAAGAKDARPPGRPAREAPAAVGAEGDDETESHDASD